MRFLKLLWYFISQVAGLVGLGMTIWGSVLVFGNYGLVTYDEASESSTFCHEVPYVFAFVLLVMRLIGIPIFVCCSCMMLISACASLCGYALARRNRNLGGNANPGIATYSTKTVSVTITKPTGEKESWSCRYIGSFCRRSSYTLYW